jgi:hypothetical protein
LIYIEVFRVQSYLAAPAYLLEIIEALDLQGMAFLAVSGSRT